LDVISFKFVQSPTSCDPVDFLMNVLRQFETPSRLDFTNATSQPTTTVNDNVLPSLSLVSICHHYSLLYQLDLGEFLFFILMTY
jgi:hypothetical protein